MKYVTVTEDNQIPGVILRDGVAYGEAGGNYFPVKGLMWSPDNNCYVPILDIPMMSDERWNEIAAAQKAAG